jgi:hypothetical protein
MTDDERIRQLIFTLDREKIVVPYGMKLFDEWVVPEGGTRTVADDAEHAETDHVSKAP